MISRAPLLIDETRLSRELEELAQITDATSSEAGTAVTRVVYTERDLEARSWLKQLALESDLTVREDAVGNTFFRWEGRDSALPPVATGSHIDAIPHAGMYDGTVGVLGGLEAIRALRRDGRSFPRSIELVLFTAEEPTRFGIGCLGSRLLAGTLAPEQADLLRDGEGKTLKEVRTQAGFTGPLDTVRLTSGHYHAWLELHIEQGPLLERAGLPLGIVTAIAAPASYRFTLEGVGGHAGALLMPDRHDALCAAAELILAVERNALALGTLDTVATIGTCQVFPGAVNSVPSRAVLQLDLRDVDPDRRDCVMQALRNDILAIEKRRGVAILEERINADTPARCALPIVSLIEKVCGRLGITILPMVSRAYHDTLFMERIAPIGMLFIPCRGGVSHRPDEFASAEHIALGTRVLAETLAAIASE